MRLHKKYQDKAMDADELSNARGEKDTGSTKINFSETPQLRNPTLKFLSPFNLGSQLNEEKNNPTDRFIPSRKLLKNQSLFEYAEDSQLPSANLNSQTNVAAMYKKYILSENQAWGETKHIQSFSNKNILKYKHTAIDLETPLLKNKSSLEFSGDLTPSINGKRKFQKLPCKVLDAPALQDDYYLNLIDWSHQNIMAVGLGSSVYLWNSNNSKVTKLCDLGIDDAVTSVSFPQKDATFSMGTNSGLVQIWDLNKMSKIRTMNGHKNRVGVIGWNSTIFSTGSRDKGILHRDLRIPDPYFASSIGHRQEVCGLKWSPDSQQFCSGGNDNQLLIWNLQLPEPIVRYNDHTAAVKAMAWSPHEHGLLVSGGGTADRTIKFRKTLTGQTLKSIDTGSQVCNLLFSKTVNELVSAHGYSQNEINIWKCPKMEKLVTLTGHSHRVLYLAMSPDGSTVVSGAGDETLRFWDAFPSIKDQQKERDSLLNEKALLLR